MKVKMVQDYALSDGLNIIVNEKKGAVIEVGQELGNKLINKKKVAILVKEAKPTHKDLGSAPSNKSKNKKKFK